MAHQPKCTHVHFSPYLRSVKCLNPRQARWALFFTRFRFTVTYRPGTKNTKADALSRQTEKVNQTNNNDNIIPDKILVAPVQWDIMTEIEQLNLQNPPPPESPADCTYVPESLRPRLMTQVHTSPSSGHPGINATAHLLSNCFWWPSVLTDTTKFVQNCNTSKSPSRSAKPTSHTTPTLVPYRH